MCRNIRTLHNFEPPATTDEVYAAALQYVRKVSGMQKPSQANEAVFARAVDAVAHTTEHLLAERYGASAAEETDDPKQAYAHTAPDVDVDFDPRWIS